MQLSQERKDQVFRAIAELNITLFENRSFSEENFAPVADFILGKIDIIQTEEELLSFLSELVEKWPVFEPILNQEKNKNTVSNTAQVTQNIVDLAKEGKIDEAIDMAKQATSQQ